MAGATHGRSEAVRGRGLGWDYVHAAVDDRTRLAYAEVLPDAKGPTCAAFLHRLHRRGDRRHAPPAVGAHPLLTEPGRAAALAALTSVAYRPADGERVAVVLCGANTDPGEQVPRA